MVQATEAVKPVRDYTGNLAIDGKYQCRYCYDYTIGINHKYCNNCGAYQDCPHCNAEFPRDGSIILFCHNCGKKPHARPTRDPFKWVRNHKLGSIFLSYGVSMALCIFFSIYGAVIHSESIHTCGSVSIVVVGFLGFISFMIYGLIDEYRYW